MFNDAKDELKNDGDAVTVLVADDEPEIRKILMRYLTRQGYAIILASNGREALGLAKVQHPGLVLLDVNMPEIDGFTVCQKLRENPATRLTPVLMLTARGSTADKVTGLSIGADDYLPKPFDLEELRARIETLLKRNCSMISANPLTKLPGSPTIQKEIETRISSKEKFGIAYIDIDHFKAYNDAYGYHQGDRVIEWTAELIQKIIREFEGADSLLPKNSRHCSFVGHIGGDDFIVVTDADIVRELCQRIAGEFDKNRKVWYNWFHGIQGYVQTKDRQGNHHKFPLMALSIAVSTNEKRKIDHYGQVSQITCELKKFVKDRGEKEKSAVAVDRRIS